MTCRACLIMTTVIASLAVDGCDHGAPAEGATPAATQGGASATIEHAGYGTLNAIDRAAGTVNISHEAVTSAGWPAMTMTFKLADPNAVPEVTPGQRIGFRFTTEGGGTVTGITPAE